MQLMLTLMAGGIALMLCGWLYQRSPNLFRHGLWMKTSIAIRTMTPEAYVLYIKGIGKLYIIGGMILFGTGLAGLLIDILFHPAFFSNTHAVRP